MPSWKKIIVSGSNAELNQITSSAGINIKTVGSFLIVELMRQGRTPQEACEEAVGRIVEKQNGKPDFQVAYLATNKKGDTGAYSIHKGFSFTKYKNKTNHNITSKAMF